MLRNVETYSGPYTKKYDIYVDDVLVREHVLPRAEGGEGYKVYDFPVTDPAALAATADGKARIRYEYRLGTLASDGFFDPSIADLWVLPLGADTRGAGRVGGRSERHGRQRRLVPLGRHGRGRGGRQPRRGPGRGDRGGRRPGGVRRPGRR